MTTLSQIINGQVTPESFTQGDDIHVALLIKRAYEATLAVGELIDIYTSRCTDGKPHNSYRTRMVDCGLWGTDTLKNGKINPKGVVKRKAELVSVYGKEGVNQVAEYKVLCAFDAMRVELGRRNDLTKEQEKQAAALLPIEPTVEGKEAEAIVKPLSLTEDKGAIKVSSALGRLNKLVAMFDGDDTYQLLVDEIKAVVQELAA